MTVFFTSDTHFNHGNIIKYCKNSRGHFLDTESMTETIINNWNRKVSTDDTIYHLGDFGFGNIPLLNNISKRLHGRKILISGNHDKKIISSYDFLNDGRWIVFDGIREIKLNDVDLILCHYPILNWNKKHFGSIHLHGHTHGSLVYDKNALDVGVDGRPNNDLSPWSLEEILEYIKTDLENRIVLNPNLRDKV